MPGAPDTAPTAPVPLSHESLPAIWQDVLAQIGPLLASNLEKAGLPAISAPNSLVLRFPAQYNLQREFCQEPARLARAEEVLRKLSGRAWNLRVESSISAAAVPPTQAAEPENSHSRNRRLRAEAAQEPLVKKAIELFGAQIVSVDDGFGAAPAEPVERAEPDNPEEA